MIPLFVYTWKETLYFENVDIYIVCYTFLSTLPSPTDW